MFQHVWVQIKGQFSRISEWVSCKAVRSVIQHSQWLWKLILCIHSAHPSRSLSFLFFLSFSSLHFYKGTSRQCHTDIHSCAFHCACVQWGGGVSCFGNMQFLHTGYERAHHSPLSLLRILALLSLCIKRAWFWMQVCNSAARSEVLYDNCPQAILGGLRGYTLSQDVLLCAGPAMPCRNITSPEYEDHIEI